MLLMRTLASASSRCSTATRSAQHAGRSFLGLLRPNQQQWSQQATPVSPLSAPSRLVSMRTAWNDSEAAPAEPITFIQELPWEPEMEPNHVRMLGRLGSNCALVETARGPISRAPLYYR